MGAWRRSTALVPALGAGLAVVVLLTACTSLPDHEVVIDGSGRVGFVVVGDFGVGGDDEAAVASRIKTWTASRPFDAFVTVGDNVYGEGEPDDFPAAWRKPFGWVTQAGIPIVASLGNHDVETEGGTPVMRLLGMPGRWYQREVGPVALFVLDANDPANEAQLKWLRGALARSAARWKVAVFHQPAYSCGTHGSSPEVQREWVRLFQRSGVDLVLNGHDHDYQRFAPIGGVTYVVTGGGAELYEVGDCPAGTPRPAAFNDDVHQFLYVSATGNELQGRAVSAAGQVLDSFELTRPEPPDT